MRQPAAAVCDRLLACLLRFDTLRRVRYAHKTFLRNQLACGLADAVCLVLDSYERHFEVADELDLTCGQTSVLLFRQRVAPSSSTLNVGEESSVSLALVVAERNIS